MTDAILLLEALRLERERAEHHDAFAFLEAADDFGEIEVALAKLHDARIELDLRAVRHEDETRLVRCGRPPSSGDGVNAPPPGACPP